jgi:hypothetical protein
MVEVKETMKLVQMVDLLDLQETAVLVELEQVH